MFKTITHWYWNSSLYSLISSGENSMLVSMAIQQISLHQVPIITIPCTKAAQNENFA